MNIFDTYKTFVMIGKPGSGKGTQTQFLAKKTGFNVFSTGDKFREIQKADTPLGHKTAEIMDAGGLMPYWFASYLFQEAVLNLGNDEGLIYEGAARKKPESMLFHDVMTWLGRPYKAIHIQVSDEEVTNRLLERGKESGRPDDVSEVKIQTRLDAFKNEIVPSMAFFESTGNLLEINGEQTPEAVFEEILEKLSQVK